MPAMRMTDGEADDERGLGRLREAQEDVPADLVVAQRRRRLGPVIDELRLDFW